VAWYVYNSGRERLDGITPGDSSGGRRLFAWGEDYIQRLEDNGNGMHEVGLKRANGFGLFDMLGNVQEWVGDWYGENYYDGSPSKDPEGPATGEERIARGGSWDLPPSGERASSRFHHGPPYPSGEDCGFRCVLATTNAQASLAQVRIGETQARQNLISHPLEYPPLARTVGIQGDVLLDVVIGTDGSVEDAKIVTGHPNLAYAALNAVKQWRFKPFVVGGRIVRVSTQLKVSFSLTK
jgi:TonB family protein